MDLVSVLGMVIRRWYVALTVLAICMIATFQVVSHVHTEYVASGNVLFIAPYLSNAPATYGFSANPYSDLSMATYAVSTAAAGSQFKSRVVGQGGSGRVTVFNEPGKPILDMTATAPTPAAAMKTYRALVRSVGAELSARQRASGVPVASFVEVNELASPEEALPATGRRNMLALVCIGLSLVVAAAAAAGVELLESRRRTSSRNVLPLVGRRFSRTDAEALNPPDTLRRPQTQPDASAAP